MSENFFERPILNSPYAYPRRGIGNWMPKGQPTNHASKKNVGGAPS